MNRCLLLLRIVTNQFKKYIIKRSDLFYISGIINIFLVDTPRYNKLSCTLFRITKIFVKVYVVLIKQMIKTKRIYDPKEDSDGTRILITRKWPRGQKKDRFDEWIKDLSPEEDTLNKWEDSKRSEEDWKRYSVKFYPQMKESKAVDKIEELRQRSKKGEIITLLCYCEKGEHCHRYIVKSMIEGSSTVIESD